MAKITNYFIMLTLVIGLQQASQTWASCRDGFTYLLSTPRPTRLDVVEPKHIREKSQAERLDATYRYKGSQVEAEVLFASIRLAEIEGGLLRVAGEHEPHNTGALNSQLSLYFASQSFVLTSSGRIYLTNNKYHYGYTSRHDHLIRYVQALTGDTIVAAGRIQVQKGKIIGLELGSNTHRIGKESFEIAKAKFIEMGIFESDGRTHKSTSSHAVYEEGRYVGTKGFEETTYLEDEYGKTISKTTIVTASEADSTVLEKSVTTYVYDETVGLENSDRKISETVLVTDASGKVLKHERTNYVSLDGHSRVFSKEDLRKF